jgi:hypothetical protein
MKKGKKKSTAKRSKKEVTKLKESVAKFAPRSPARGADAS